MDRAGDLLILASQVVVAKKMVGGWLGVVMTTLIVACAIFVIFDRQIISFLDW